MLKDGATAIPAATIDRKCLRLMVILYTPRYKGSYKDIQDNKRNTKKPMIVALRSSSSKVITV